MAERNEPAAGQSKENNFVGYTVMLAGGIGRLTPKQESMIWDVALLANDYERLRRFIQ